MGRRTGGWGAMVVPDGSTKSVSQFPLYTMETGTVVSTKSKPETTPTLLTLLVFFVPLIHTKTFNHSIGSYCRAIGRFCNVGQLGSNARETF